MPPRILKAPVGVWFSCVTQTVAPARRHRSGQTYCGVGAMNLLTSRAACSISSLPKIGIAAPVVSDDHIRLLRMALDIGTESALWERLWEHYGTSTLTKRSGVESK